MEKTRRPPARTVVLAALAAVAVAAVAAAVLLGAEPPALSDEQALAALPAGAEILDRHAMSGGRVQQIDYRYTQEHPFCLVERTERTPFRYEGGAWTRDGGPEVLAETEDWSPLAGYWTEQTRGREARFLCLRVDGFADGVLTGQVLYRDAVSSCEGPAGELFSAGTKQSGEGPWILKGTGFFRYNYLRVDRDEGLFFDNDTAPMEYGVLPVQPPAAQDPAADEKLLERVITDPEKTWLIATEELDVYPEPSLEAEPLGTAAAGTVLAYTGPLSEIGWYQVMYGGGVGYVSGACALALTEGMSVGVVTPWAEVNVRTGPGQDFDVLGVAAAGDRLVGTGAEEGWYRVIRGGRAAYVAGDYVTWEPVTLPEE